MIEASLYSAIYLIIVTFLTIIATYRYSSDNNYCNGENVSLMDTYRGYIFAILMGLFIGFRPLSKYFVDMRNYNIIYYSLYYGEPFGFDADAENFIFDNFFRWLGANNYDITVFFVIMALCYFVFAYKAMTRLFALNAFLAYVVFLGAFSTYSYATNGIKAGVAASFFLCALGYREKPIIAGIFLFLSLGFHHSMVLPIAAYICAWFVKDSRYYFVVWIMAFLVAVAHITFFQELFAGISDERGAEYLTSIGDNWGGKSGFRLDFVLYSALPIFIGYLAIFKYNLKSKIYSFLLNVYLLTNAVWMLCMYASFTNRIAYLSWLMYPVVTIYPFFCKEFMPEQTLRLKQVIWFQLLFTLFMSVLYYG